MIVMCTINLISDILKISDLTYKVVAFAEITDLDTDECVDWAIEMIFLDHETPSLLTLAGLRKPTNYFEVTDYLPEVLSSLNLTQKRGDEATLSYCSYYIKKIANSDNIRKNLTHIYKFCKERYYEELIYDFYLLYWAWDDLDYGNDFTAYWETAKRSNIESIVVDTAKKWIQRNEQYYKQLW